jgi:hypothetical protein
MVYAILQGMFFSYSFLFKGMIDVSTLSTPPQRGELWESVWLSSSMYIPDNFSSLFSPTIDVADACKGTRAKARCMFSPNNIQRTFLILAVILPLPKNGTVNFVINTAEFPSVCCSNVISNIINNSYEIDDLFRSKLNALIQCETYAIL